MKLRVFTYDISNNRERRRVARLLEDHATRVQYSVFETRMTDAACTNLGERVQQHMSKGDSLRVYTIGKTGERSCRVYGLAPPIEKDANYWLF